MLDNNPLIFFLMMILLGSTVYLPKYNPNENNSTPNGVLNKVFSAEVSPKELNTINLSHLAKGYYLARLSNDSETTTVKLIKN